MRLPRKLVRLTAFAAAAALVLFAAASTAVAETAPPKVKLTVKASIAVRKGAEFTAKGSAASPASPGETVTVRFERHVSQHWSVVSTATVALSASRTFSVKLKATDRGLWRVWASLPATMTHQSASAQAKFKAVGAKVVALTFDDGPWPTSTAQIVSALKAGNAQATFFELGSQIGSRKALSQSVLAGGNIIGVHSWNHAIMVRRSASVNSADLAKCKKAVLAATGTKPHWFRPPYGSTNATLKKTAEKLGLRQVIWTVDTLDWKFRTRDSVVSRAMGPTHDGSIVLMHDGGGPRAATAAAVPIIIKKLRAKGFDFVTLDEMAALGYKIP